MSDHAFGSIPCSYTFRVKVVGCVNGRTRLQIYLGTRRVVRDNYIFRIDQYLKFVSARTRT